MTRLSVTLSEVEGYLVHGSGYAFATKTPIHKKEINAGRLQNIIRNFVF